VAERLWRDVHERLTAFVAQRIDDPADVADLVQTVFLRVHQHAAKVSDEEHLLPWLFQVTRNAIADHYRAPARRREVPLDAAEDPVDASGDGSGDEVAASTEALAACIRPLMERLAPIHREALALVEFDGISQVDAAARLGISVSGMKSRVQRGRVDLREALVACCEVSRSATGGVMDFEPRSEGACGPAACEPAPAAIVSLRRA
jgi:RNA polymerase sigma-70 factor (ECF subfamily)